MYFFSQLWDWLVSDNQLTICFVDENFFQSFIYFTTQSEKSFKKEEIYKVGGGKIAYMYRETIIQVMRVIKFGLLYDYNKKLLFARLVWLLEIVETMAHDGWLEIKLKNFCFLFVYR